LPSAADVLVGSIRIASTPFPQNPTSQRESFVWAWYPATCQASAKPSDYLPPIWLHAYRRDWAGQQLDLVHGHFFEKAPFSEAQKRFPVLLFSPGDGQLPSDYTALLEDLASYGYVILAAAHPFDTPLVVFPDGRVVRSSEKFQYERSKRMMVRAGDLISIVDHVAKESDKQDEFFSRLDLQKVAALGHSFGGAAAIQACALDSRLKAAMDLDGTVYGDVVTTGVRQPVFLLMGSLTERPRWLSPRQSLRFDADYDPGTLHEEMLLAHSTNYYRLTVGRLLHMNFSDKGFFFDAADRLAELLGARRNAKETIRLASTYARAFFGQCFMGVRSSGQELIPNSNPDMRLEVHGSGK
jgi:dienelactone hydrolase